MQKFSYDLKSVKFLLCLVTSLRILVHVILLSLKGGAIIIIFFSVTKLKLSEWKSRFMQYIVFGLFFLIGILSNKAKKKKKKKATPLKNPFLKLFINAKQRFSNNIKHCWLHMYEYNKNVWKTTLHNEVLSHS